MSSVRYCPHQRHRRRPAARVPFVRRLAERLADYALDGALLLALPLLFALAIVGWFAQPPPVRDDWPE